MFYTVYHETQTNRIKEMPCRNLRIASPQFYPVHVPCVPMIPYGSGAAASYSEYNYSYLNTQDQAVNNYHS